MWFGIVKFVRRGKTCFFRADFLPFSLPSFFPFLLPPNHRDLSSKHLEQLENSLRRVANEASEMSEFLEEQEKQRKIYQDEL